MSTDELISHYDALLALLPKKQVANIYHGTGMGRHEVRHCTFLYWLLDPSASHAHEAAFLNIFMSHLGIKLPKGGAQSAVVTREHSKGKYGRMDITVIAKDFLYMVIEAKTDSKDSVGCWRAFKITQSCALNFTQAL